MPSTTRRHGVIPQKFPNSLHGMIAPMNRKIACFVSTVPATILHSTHTVEKLIDHILESVILGLHTVVVVPGECVADDEAREDVVRPKYTDDAKGEEGECNTKGQERLVVNEAGVR